MTKPLPAQTLKEFLKDRGISQSAFAVKLHRSAGLINNIVCGRQAASVNTRADFHRIYPGYDVIEMRMTDEEVAKFKVDKLAPNERTFTESIPVRGRTVTARQKLPEPVAEFKPPSVPEPVPETKNGPEMVFVLTHEDLYPQVFKSIADADKWVANYVITNLGEFGFSITKTELL